MTITNSSALSWTAFSHTPQINNKLNLYLLSRFLDFQIFKSHCSYNSELFFALKRMRTPQIKILKSKFKLTFKHPETGVLVTLELPKARVLVTNLKMVRLITKNDKFINTRVKMSTNKRKGNERRKQRQSCYRRKRYKCAKNGICS